jgi:hypothetical protein
MLMSLHSSNTVITEVASTPVTDGIDLLDCCYFISSQGEIGQYTAKSATICIFVRIWPRIYEGKGTGRYMIVFHWNDNLLCRGT